MRKRIQSIDIIRALTMLLMIFVNDLWTLHEIPGWLEHKRADVDGMGLADVVFPAFLVIVGLSIPHAIRARQKRGDSKAQVLRHIGERTLALVLMGLYMVNVESLGEDTLLSKDVWTLLMVFAFFLIWNVYRGKVGGRLNPWIPKGLGWAILLFLAIIYRGGDGGWMQVHWWGILGLIGWGYLLSAVFYLYVGPRPGWIALALLLLVLLNVNEFVSPFNESIKLVVSASNYALVLCGVLVTSISIRLGEEGRMKLLLPTLLGLAAALLAFGFLSRPLWGISKILATPSWTAICAALTIGTFLLLYLLADLGGKVSWAKVIAPAGSMTLTCYLVPYYVYSFRNLLGIQLPDVLTTALPGILKSILFALLIIQLTGWLGRAGIKLKI